MKIFYKLFVLLVTCLMAETAAFKHIVFMHGILSGPTEVDTMKTWIEKAHPGTNITAIDMFDRLTSLDPMWKQINTIKTEIQQIMNDSRQGTIFICYSQGGLICRGLLSILDHNVETFIALSSPLMGQYGDSSYLKYLFPNYLKSNIYKYFYSEGGQKWSVANYWNDPHHQDLYLKYSQFLAVINNQSNNPLSVDYKKNFLKLKNFVMVGGPDDGVITPWQSSHMDYYNSNETVVGMRQQPYYTNDWFGLKTLDERKAIHRFTMPGVQHVHWYNTRLVFDKCILPFLT